MNLYFRLLVALMRAWRAPCLSPGDTLLRHLRVLPNDLDVNGHMNNGRYLTLVDLLLVEYFVRTGFAAAMLRQGWRPMAGGSLITYRCGLTPLQTYSVRLRLDACDVHWSYMRFEFAREGRICAAGFIKGAAVGRAGLVPNAKSYEAAGLSPLLGELPSPVRDWLAAERGVMASAW
jgi:acyl-CoA thioesterase FadM